MRAKQLIKTIGDFRGRPFTDFKVTGVSCNSKNVSPGFIFVAIKGRDLDGEKFIPEAVRSGARLIVACGSGISVSGPTAPYVAVRDARKALAQLSAAFYGYPSKRIKAVGITGTNGKTTVSYLLEKILEDCGFSSGVTGTVNYRFKDKIFSSRNTTPCPTELQAMLAEMLKERVKYAVMEVSSHALDQARTQGIDFHSAIFTNLTRDHLDYHLNMRNYFSAKAILFKGLSQSAFCVLNNDSPYSNRLKDLTKAKVVTYGIDKVSQVMAEDIKLGILGTEFMLVTGKKKSRVNFKLIGRHNIYNILAAIAWALEEGLGLPKIKSALEAFALIPGRLERIPCRAGFSVFVDYAHTDDALKNVLSSLRQLAEGKLIVVFGCGGNRDKGKRPKMGRVVSELADLAVITSDNPRREDPDKIIKDIKKGISKNNYLVFPDRREAIEKALSMAKAKDTVLISGKGHEDYQVLKDRSIPFNDCEVARECLRLMNY